MRVIDVFTSLPTPERIALEVRSWGREPGYLAMFGARWSKLMGLNPETIAAVAELPARGFVTKAAALLEPELPPAEVYVAQLIEAGIDKAVVHRPLPCDVDVTDEITARLVDQFPDTLIGFARFDPRHGADRAAEELEHAVTELGMRGVTITPFWHGISCEDEVLEPVLATAERLGVPAWIHTSQHWRRSVPLELEHPRHIDVIAARHPDLWIACGHGGWPWMVEMVAVAWRHPRVMIDVSAFRPRNVFQPGSGWEPLVHYGQRGLSDSILYGSTWGLLGLTPSAAVAEATAVAWPDDVKEKWLSSNGVRFLGLETA